MYWPDRVHGSSASRAPFRTTNNASTVFFAIDGDDRDQTIHEIYPRPSSVNIDDTGKFNSWQYATKCGLVGDNCQ